MGVSKHPQQRFKQHLRQPNKRMRKDVDSYAGLEDWSIEVVAEFSSRHAAHMCEQRLIEQHKTRGTAGYNTLPGAPGCSQQFWMLYHRNKL